MIQYGEAYEQARPGLGDSMALQRYTDVPMAALWTYRPERNVRTAHVADIRGSASVAHIYGQNIVAAEALTASYAPWAFSPRDLKPVIDLGFALGINRPVIHTSVHQPLLDKVPGLTLLIFGQYFNRNETWAEQAGAWVSYLARTSYLLQQGRYAADIVYFYGEEAPLTALFSEQGAPDMPSTVGFDFANADVVLNQLQVDRGDLVTEGGMRYRLLFLGGTSEQMTLPVLRRIGELINEGATVVGDMPTATPSLADDQEAFSALAHEIWNGADTGKGRIIAGQDVRAALDSLGVRPDFQYEEPSPDSEIMFLHRRLDDGDIYFLTNRTPRSESIQGRFRVSGKRPEIWHAETGQRQAVSYSIENGITTVPLSFDPHEAFFVVFRDAADQPELVVPEPTVEPLSSLDGKWEVRFEAGRGGPESPRDLEIGSWAEHEDAAIRYFSGTATYSRNIDVPQEWLDGAGRIELDMGDVRELVEVSLNGTSLGVSWRPPYRVDLTDALQAGKNQLELEVTNLWVNRLIGDAGNEGPKHTFTILPSYLPDAPLRASGLIGPVRIERVGPGGLIN